MKTQGTIRVYMLSFLILLMATGYTQNLTQNDASQEIITDSARDIMTSAGTCALITPDEKGRPKARAIDAFDQQDDFTEWFGTNRNSRKVAQIINHPRVTLNILKKDDPVGADLCHRLASRSGHPFGAIRVKQILGKTGDARSNISAEKPYGLTINMGGDEPRVVAIVYRKL